jgi:hypothetical protein
MNSEQSVNIPNLQRLVALKQDFNRLVDEVASKQQENSYFTVLLGLQKLGYTLREIDQFQEVQELL